ncbi:MAG: M48 family metallopeptidase [Candidatus Sumerlaeia bacterium]
MPPSGFTTDFFGNQERARRKTGRLVLLFLAAVVLIILAVYVVVSLAWFAINAKMGDGRGRPPLGAWDPLNLQLFLIVAGGTTALIASGTLYKVIALGKGGDAVARLLGGRPIVADGASPDERKVLNVVEEMSLASGVPVPNVYILDKEFGINAFAAGFSPSSCVIGVTRGAAMRLTRDELQGVIAHEFSHILNGDMRLNIRLMGLLHGILLIGLTGRGLIQAVLRGGGAGGRRSSSSKRDSGQIALVLLGLGVALFVIGYIGVFFGALIKAAVSRQREFLADASAVQFTRNPAGIAGALLKIGSLSKGSQLQTPRAQEASHMFFGNALKSAFSGGLLSTHPPLPERIRAILPTWDGKFPEPPVSEAVRETEEFERRVEEHRRRARAAAVPPPIPFPLPAADQVLPGAAGAGAASGLTSPAGLAGQAAAGAAAGAAGFRYDIPPERLMREIGQLTPDSIQRATRLLSAIPEPLRDVARHPLGAQAVVMALLLSDEDTILSAQMQYIERQAGRDVAEYIGRVKTAVEALGPAARLPLITLSLPALRGLKPQEADRFLNVVDALVEADKQVTMFELVVVKIVRRHLTPIVTGRADQAPVRYYSINAVAEEISVVLSALVWAGGGGEAEQRRAFAAGLARLSAHDSPVRFLPREDCGAAQLNEALDRLRESIPGVKRRVLEALSWATAADKTITVEEAELLRAVAETLDCPLPPLVAGG